MLSLMMQWLLLLLVFDDQAYATAAVDAVVSFAAAAAVAFDVALFAIADFVDGNALAAVADATCCQLCNCRCCCRHCRCCCQYCCRCCKLLPILLKALSMLMPMLQLLPMMLSI